ncbi:hypothetical protein WMF18_03060 [Sorangium sp. So ce315]|uniref:hypothetical protein n=1 Tax=Sorangium sp. So ce315 TaxID=3133299 RepID=UPI003F5DB347
MKRCVSRTVVLVFALCSLGAKECTPGSSQFDQDSGLPFCHTDPPVFCAAYCSGVRQVAFTSACSDVGADKLEILFELKVMEGVRQLEAQGTQVCPAADPTSFVTPCSVDIIPQEWPNQDHGSCQPVPPGCPMF